MNELREIFESLFNQFKELFPKLLGAIVLLVLGWLIAKTLASIIQKILIGIKADKLTDKLKDIDIFAKSNLDIRLSTIVSKTIYYFVLLTFTIAATEFLGLLIISKQIADILNFIPKAIAAGIVFLVGVIFANFIRNAISTAFRSLGIPSGNLISAFIFYFLLITISITALAQTGMDTDFLTQNIQILLSGIVIAFAVGFGLASRPILRNLLAAGYSKQKINIGMTIKVCEVVGQVIDIDSTAVTLLQENDHKVIIPQSEIISSKIEIF